ncbi:class C sortase [Lacticaseibacillus brantae]|uniref:class C sortase n=1 Tax=Lacticaseibacillus brantae TaxID=943673 RepID=UPI00070BA43C|nr:class C sortase [Lacticaseibacillus brantae]
MRRIKLNRLEIGSLVLIAVAVLLLAYPIAANYFANIDRGHAVTRYQKDIKELAPKVVAQEFAAAQAYNDGIWQQQRNIPAKLPNYNTILPDASGVMGMLNIPAIDIVNMPFYHGSNDDVLEKGLGHMKMTSVPIGGKNTRAVITGHSGLANQQLFSDINKLQVGDYFFIQVLDRKLAYKVHDIQKVKPDQVNAIKIRRGQDAVTLLTCWPAGINSDRLLVTGYRTAYTAARKAPVQKRNFWNYEHIVLMLLGLAVIIIAYAYYRNRTRKQGGRTSVEHEETQKN